MATRFCLGWAQAHHTQPLQAGRVARVVPVLVNSVALRSVPPTQMYSPAVHQLMFKHHRYIACNICGLYTPTRYSLWLYLSECIFHAHRLWQGQEGVMAVVGCQVSQHEEAMGRGGTHNFWYVVHNCSCIPVGGTRCLCKGYMLPCIKWYCALQCIASNCSCLGM